MVNCLHGIVVLHLYCMYRWLCLSEKSSTSHTAIFLLDAWTEVYVWLGWWPQVQNKLLKEANATTGSAHSKWLRDKKLALETAQLYVKGC